ncbi:MAG TPA: zinc ribbon domain-containing protein [Chthonomonadales bacterium]|nr:zinc ribbon domain-containing protein [Chthonomonadales bacterium]
MPIYEFHCKECRSEFRTLRRSEQLSDVRCPSCGAQRVARLLSVTAAGRAAEVNSCAMPGSGGG